MEIASRDDFLNILRNQPDKLESEFGTKEFSFLIGSNEEMCYESLKELLSEFSFKELKEDEVKVLKDLKLKSIGFEDALSYILCGEFIEEYEDKLGEDEIEDFLGKEVVEKYCDYFEF